MRFLKLMALAPVVEVSRIMADSCQHLNTAEERYAYARLLWAKAMLDSYESHKGKTKAKTEGGETEAGNMID
jgi:hypothetical protein